MDAPQLVAAALIGTATFAAGNATAAEVVAPVDGDTVAARPAFIVDYAEGTLDVELARSPDVLTAGDRAGAFIEPVRDNFMLIGPPFTAAWGRAPALVAGAYYWHAKANDYATEIERGFVTPWIPVRTLRVRDEPPVVEGWTLRARRITRSGCARRYRRAWLLNGTIAWQDNSEPATARYTLTLSHTSGRRLRLTGSLAATTARFAHRV